MSRFEGFNTENKLRIPLTAFAAQIIESDCMNFSQKKTTLINSIILNFYQQAECSISLRTREYREELEQSLCNRKAENDERILQHLVDSRASRLMARYAKRLPADVNWQITLNKRVKAFLTEDSYTNEESYYGPKPGHYVRALIEEYAQLPYHKREEIIFKPILDLISSAILSHKVINLTNTHGIRMSIRPYQVATDPLSMYHYLVGYSTATSFDTEDNTHIDLPSQVVSIRIARLVDAEIQYYQSGKLTEKEKLHIQHEIKEKTVPFLSGQSTPIKIWLSDNGIRKYESQLHVRPVFTARDEKDEHIFYFECTELQILYYFFSFGKDVRIISPENLRNRFIETYREALKNYEE